MGPYKSFNLHYVLYVTSAMIRAANARWDLRVQTYETEAELIDTLHRFAAGIMQRERRGDLDQLD